MKRLILFITVAFLTVSATAQPVRISGKLLNCTNEYVEFIMRSAEGDRSDSIKVNADGTFSYQTSKITKPMGASITNRKQIQIQLFVAPGYDLKINADVKDYVIARATTTYEGQGAATNAYWSALFKNYKQDTVKWASKDAETYARFLMRKPRFAQIRDSIFSASNKDPYKDYFKKGLEIDEKYGPLNSIFASYAFENNYTWKQIQDLIKKIGMGDYEKDLNNENNLASSSFRYFVESYAFYCENYNAFPEDSLLKKENGYTLYLSSKFFTGKVYDYTVGESIIRSLSSTYKFDDIKKFTPYIHKLSDEKKAQIEPLIKKRELSASGLQAGNVSPGFNLADPSGKLHNMADFKGKVIYIDLWASWCGPCREENPFFKKVYEKYKKNDKIAFISIAAFDAKNRERRYAIMKEEAMEWLQLEDTVDSFAKSYQASFIPRFIIVDKEGKIVDSDAPRPSDGNKLTDILNREIAK